MAIFGTREYSREEWGTLCLGGTFFFTHFLDGPTSAAPQLLQSEVVGTSPTSPRRHGTEVALSECREVNGRSGCRRGKREAASSRGKEKQMVDKTKKALQVENLENRVAPILVVAPAPEPAPEPAPGGGSGTITSTPVFQKHDNPGWNRKMQELI
jgi:hypothetical protein